MFIDRDASGTITAIFAARQRAGQEELSATAADLLAFLSPTLLGSVAALSNPVPESVTAGQLIRALDNVGLLRQVDAVVARADTLTQRLWSRAGVFPRKDPMIEAVAQALGKSSTELDNVFRLAANL
jgi:uncharacterized protein YcaQ